MYFFPASICSIMFLLFFKSSSIFSFSYNSYSCRSFSSLFISFIPRSYSSSSWKLLSPSAPNSR